jgi:hypothetical protein
MCSLTPDQIRALDEYAQLKLSLEDLRQRLVDVLEFDFGEDGRTLRSYFGTPEPGVRVGLSHVRAAMQKHAEGQITTAQLSDWATMLLLNDAYVWDGPDQDQMSEWLNDISALTLRSKTGGG